MAARNVNNQLGEHDVNSLVSFISRYSSPEMDKANVRALPGAQRTSGPIGTPPHSGASPRSPASGGAHLGEKACDLGSQAFGF